MQRHEIFEMGRNSKNRRRTMAATEAAATKKRRLSESKEAKKKRKQRLRAFWNTQWQKLDAVSNDIRGETGKSRSFEEMRLLLLAIKAALKQRIFEKEEKISWRQIDEEVAEDFRVGRMYISDLRRTFLEDGDICVYGGGYRGGSAPGAKESKSTKITDTLLKEISTFIDTSHSKGEAVVARDVMAMLFDKYQLDVHRTTVGRAVKRLGLSYSQIQSAKRTYSSYRVKAIKDYLIDLDKYCRQMQTGENDQVFVFVDESYVNVHHGCKKSYLPTDTTKDSKLSTKSGKGKRLVILHAISEDGPMVEREDYGIPVDDLIWTRDTPHPQDREDGKKTCETLWMANSHTGDYHDNMCSSMFMQWVENKLIPVFEKLYPGKRMVLVADNAPYHHKRVIGSLGHLNKTQMVDLMVQHKVEWIDIPLVSQGRLDMALSADEFEDVQDRGDCIRIPFDAEEQRQRAGATKPRIATLEEMKVGFVLYCKEEKPYLLACQVEKYMNERNHNILWTPPYCPELQPIELFWAAGKNNVAKRHNNETTMKDVVKHLREGWYGNFNEFANDDPRRKKPVNCRKLWSKCLDFAGTKYVGLCEGITGRMGELIIDHSIEDESVTLPIDTMIIDMTTEVQLGGESYQIAEM